MSAGMLVLGMELQYINSYVNKPNSFSPTGGVYCIDIAFAKCSINLIFSAQYANVM